MKISKEEYITLAEWIYEHLPKGYVYILSSYDGQSLPVIAVYYILRQKRVPTRKQLLAYIIVQDKTPSLYVLLLKTVLGPSHWADNHLKIIAKFKSEIQDKFNNVTFAYAPI